MLVNTERAREILARENYGGLLAVQPINQYYLSDYWGLFNTPGGYEGAYWSLFPADPQAPAALIVPALEIRRLKTTSGTWMPNVFAYSAPGASLQLADSSPRGSDYSGWPVVIDGELSDREQAWVDITSQLGSQMSPDAFWAVARAIRSAELEGSRLATDDARVAGWLASCKLDGLGCDYRPELFNEIRLVKTEAELALLRNAASVNERSLLAAARQLHEGADWRDIQNIYMEEMARQGGRGVYLMCGVGELPAERVRQGEPIMLDALGQVARYHGDFGRCAVVGKPTIKHLKRHRAILCGWETAQELLKPGVRYSELSVAVGNAVRKAGLKNFRDPIVHSVGLEHTDDPKPPGVQPQTKPDQTLRNNMVVNVDLPHTEIGWGSVHMEDTVRITETGFERLSAANFDLIVAG